MLVNIDAPDIAVLSQQFGQLVSDLLEVIKIPAMPQAVEITHAGNFSPVIKMARFGNSRTRDPPDGSERARTGRLWGLLAADDALASRLSAESGWRPRQDSNLRPSD